MAQVTAGLEAHYPEHWVRGCFQDHARQIACVRRLRAAPAGRPRLAGTPDADTVALHVHRLVGGRHVAEPRLADAELLSILSDLGAFVKDESRLAELLSMLPACAPLGALWPIGAALFHPNASVRSTAASILRTVEGYKDSNPCVARLNTFLLLGLDPVQ